MDSITYSLVFYLVAAITLGGAAVVVFSRNIIHSAFSLLLTLFGVACFFIMLGGDFLAVTQFMIYIGGILVLILFGVMLTQKVTSIRLRDKSTQMIPALIGIILVAFAMLNIIVSQTEWPQTMAGEYGNTINEIGRLILTDYLLPFEIASVLLLAALIGAVYAARKERMP